MLIIYRIALLYRLMRKKIVVVAGLFIMSIQVYGVAPDSLGLQKAEGKWFIRHQIEQGETFYRLSVRYGVETEAIMRANSNISVLSVGQEVRIPFSESPYFEHQVTSGQTMYAIATKYNVTVDDLKTWNNMASADIQPGDILRLENVNTKTQTEVVAKPATSPTWSVHIVTGGETLYAISKQYAVPVDSLKSWNYLTSNEIEEGMYLRYMAKEVEMEAQIEPVASMEVVSSEPVELPYDVVQLPWKEERGLAALIDGQDVDDKFLALHRSAPNGTILMVRNEMNDQVVFVRVIGQLPDTGANDKLIVKISKPAWENIHAVNSRFRVKVSYQE